MENLRLCTLTLTIFYIYIYNTRLYNSVYFRANFTPFIIILYQKTGFFFTLFCFGICIYAGKCLCNCFASPLHHLYALNLSFPSLSYEYNQKYLFESLHSWHVVFDCPTIFSVRLKRRFIKYIKKNYSLRSRQSKVHFWVLGLSGRSKVVLWQTQSHQTHDNTDGEEPGGHVLGSKSACQKYIK